MNPPARAAGTYTLNGTSTALTRMGYGAMQLTGKMAWGPPPDKAAAIAVLREAITLGVNHIDTSDYYGPHIANQIIREALHPYPRDLVIATKVGARRGPDKSWPAALSRRELTDAVHDNLRNLGIEALDLVNLRVGEARGTSEAAIAEPLGVLADLKRAGLIRNVGLSNITPAQLAEGTAITAIACVQNRYNLAYRQDDAMIDDLARRAIAFVPFFPLGGFSPLQAQALTTAAEALGATTTQVALAWLLRRAPNLLVIPGTSSVEHLRQNVAAAALHLPDGMLASLDAVAGGGEPA